MTVEITNLKPTIEYWEEEYENILDDDYQYAETIRKRIARLKEINQTTFQISTLADFDDIITELYEMEIESIHIYYNDGSFVLDIED